MSKTLPAVTKIQRSQMRRTVAGVELQRSLEKGAWFATINGRRVKFCPILGRYRNNVLQWEACDVTTQEWLGRAPTLSMLIKEVRNEREAV